MSPLLEVDGVKKTLGRTVVIHHGSLTIHPGTIHALLGESGSGKSALMKCLSGVWAPESGVMRYGGTEEFPGSVAEAARYGIRLVSQGPSLIPDWTVAQNIQLGTETSRWGRLQKSEDSPLSEWLNRFGLTQVKPETRVRGLNRFERRVIELIRGFMAAPELLLLDAATEGLSRQQVATLGVALREYREGGKAVLFSTTRPQECASLADVTTILCEGRSVATGDIHQVSSEQLSQVMTGLEPAELFPRSPHTRGAPALEIMDFTPPGAAPTTLTAYSGEILGLFGVPGAGRTRLLRAIAGLIPAPSKEFFIQGRGWDSENQGARWRAGIGYQPQGDPGSGLFPNRAVGENLLVTRLDAVSVKGFIRGRSERFMALDWMEHTDVEATSENELVMNLKAGSQRRLAAGRLYYHQAPVLLMDEPCQRMDITSRIRLYRRMDKAALSGKSVLFCSSNPVELLAICDRVGVVREGAVQEIRPVSEWDREALWTAAWM
ncbi:MAG TPA: ATP-binding cassette domain-containing protein [Candidatus Limnocylindria bacterium]|nr:ATP-binding cassette domain-containing protein [Candidatus Limnocylindria bacterium]